MQRNFAITSLILECTDISTRITDRAETYLDSIEGSWKNSQDSSAPKLIKDPTSVADKLKS